MPLWITVTFFSGTPYCAVRSSLVDWETAITLSATSAKRRKLMKKCQRRRLKENVSGNNSNERSWAVTTSLVCRDTEAKFRFGKKNTSVPPSNLSSLGKRRYQSERLRSLLGKRNIFRVTLGYLVAQPKSKPVFLQALKKSTYSFSISRRKSPSKSAKVYSSTPVRFPSMRHRISIPMRINTETYNLRLRTKVNQELALGKVDFYAIA